jgi:hypothetical protein
MMRRSASSARCSCAFTDPLPSRSQLKRLFSQRRQRAASSREGTIMGFKFNVTQTWKAGAGSWMFGFKY